MTECKLGNTKILGMSFEKLFFSKSTPIVLSDL